MVTKKRVLVIDDEQGIVNVVRIKLGLLGYEVLTASRGSEAIDIIRTSEPDVVLLDLLMPGMTGEDVLVKVREFSEVPIIVFTAKLDVSESLANLGVDEIVLKPFDPDHLAVKIAEVLERSQGMK